MTEALGRKITLDDFQIHLGNPCIIYIQNLHMANADWGSEPDMMHIGKLSAEINPNSLWAGRIEYRKLTVDDFDILLERDASGMGNWRLDNKPHPPQTGGGIAIIPKDRAQFPLLIDMQLRHGLVRLRTSSGKILRIAADNFDIGTDSDSAPMHLSWQGSYNNIPAQLNAEMDPYQVLHDAAKPDRMHLIIALSKSKLNFVGTMMNPLDSDGVDGQMQIQTTELGELLSMLGIQQPSGLSLSLSGPFTRQGDHWRWHNTVGALANNDLSGDLALDEGARAKPDHIDFNLSAGKFDLKSVWDGLAAGPKMQAGTFDDITALFLNLKLSAEEFLYGSLHLFSPAVELKIEPGKVALMPSTFIFSGGKTTMSGDITSARNNLQFTANASISGGKMTQLASWFHADPNLLTGDFDIAARLDMSGPILDQALKSNSRGGMVFSMNGGSVAKDSLEKTSVDLRTLFHHDDGHVPVQCMLGILYLHNGTGTLDPLKLRTSQGSLTGDGQIDFMQQRVDIVMQSDAARSGTFALDIPLRISGPFSNIGIMPASSPNFLHPAIQNLSAPLQQLAAHNNCLR